MEQESSKASKKLATNVKKITAKALEIGAKISIAAISKNLKAFLSGTPDL